ncbi:MAG: ATP-binding protein, partial [Actinobacteria bacterium]|nr:ATP-binding protein [Actinomycetota bacterium]
VVDPAAFLDAVIDQVPEEEGGRERVIIEAEGGSVRIDPARLGLVLQNLVLNALKFSAPPDAVVVRMASSPGHVTVDVVDRGIGIPTEDLATIFDRFRQVGRALRREREGVGIGLYIARRLAEAMGGTIEVSSVVGEGSTFRVVVPQLPVEPEDPAGVSSGTT